VKIETIIEQLQSLRGQSVEVEGYFIVIETNRQKIPFISSTADIAEKDQQQIFLDHSLAELKIMIRPLPSMQLLFRGTMTNPPYFHRFPIMLTATVDKDSDDKPILKQITHIEIDIPYTGKLSQLSGHDTYHYLAMVDYTPQRDEKSQRTAQAVVQSQKHLILSDQPLDNVEIISEEENRYARRMVGAMVRIGGWLRTINFDTDTQHLVLATSALRASVVAVGPLKDLTHIWIRPSDLYQLIKSHIPFSVEQDFNQRVEIIGKVDYIHDNNLPANTENLPKIVFTNITGIIIHEKNLLW